MVPVYLKPVRILGIETSADETAAAVVEDGQLLLSNVVASSIEMTARYGGIVPEIAARSHLESITPVIDQALKDSGSKWSDIDAIAVTRGPGLGGSLLIGTLAARSLALAKNKPLYGVNHVQAHIYANFITQASPALAQTYKLPPKSPQFPLLALVVSGGHSQIVHMKSHQHYQLLGKATDDAVGEAFDKVARLLGLPQPGGPSIAQAATSGDPAVFKLPSPTTVNPYDFSFSGLKTAVLRRLQALCGQSYDFPSGQIPALLSKQQVADMAACFQSTAVSILENKLKKAFEEYRPSSVLLAGGVAANQTLRARLSAALPVPPLYPDIKLCTDNAAMIASLAFFRPDSQAEATSLEIDPGLKM